MRISSAIGYRKIICAQLTIMFRSRKTFTYTALQYIQYTKYDKAHKSVSKITCIQLPHFGQVPRRALLPPQCYIRRVAAAVRNLVTLVVSH